MRIINCDRCKMVIETSAPYKKYCELCRKIAYRDPNKLWKKNNTPKNKAELLIATEIRAKRLIKPTELKCNRCFSMAEEYHHFNYDYPLSVIPLCIKCHHLVHKDKLK